MRFSAAPKTLKDPKMSPIVYRWFSIHSRVYGSLVIPEKIDKSKVTVMSDIYMLLPCSGEL